MDTTQTKTCEYTDVEWVHKIKEDDPIARDCLWEDVLRFSCDQSIGRFNQDEQFATDAATTAFFRICAKVKANKYELRGPFKHWYRRIVANCIIDMLRALGRGPKYVSLPDDYERHGKLDPGFEEVVNGDSFYEQIQKCLKQLTEKEYEAFTLRYPCIIGEDPPEERTTEEVAEILSERWGRTVTRNEVNVLVWRARKKLKPYLDGFRSED